MAEIDGSARSDLLIGTAGADEIHAGAGNDLVLSGAGDDVVYGDAGNDVLFGGAGNDILDGGRDNDLLVGGEGDDRLYGGAGIDVLLGGEGRDWLQGGTGLDCLDGGAGVDTAAFSGKRGDYLITTLNGVTTVRDLRISDGDDGADMMVRVERLQFADRIVFLAANRGPTAQNDAAGVSENSVLTIAAAALLGNDADVDGDRLAITSVANGQHGTAVLNADGSITYTPAAYFCGKDTIVYTISDGFGGTTTASVVITVKAVADAPTLGVSASASGDEGAIALSINATLVDQDGSESLSITIAGVPAGAVLSAGTNNNDGTWTLAPSELAGLTITPPTDRNLDFTLTVIAISTEATGESATTHAQIAVDVNWFNDMFGSDDGEDLIGTNAADRLYGYGGRDRLYAKDSDDALYGGAGNDQLHGLGGADLMFGGSGDDLYLVENIGDVVSEETVAGVDDGGVDTVESTITFTLGAFLERLKLTGTAAIDGAGNDLDNRLTGNEAANTLSGRIGVDILLGNGGDDWLIGGAGKDDLTGGAGADTFVFGFADTASTDKVRDFSEEDRIGIYAGDYGLSLGSGLVDDGAGKLVLDSAYFAAVSGSATTVQGTSSGHGQFVFSFTASTRTLMWDADGAGASSGVPLATFNAGTMLDAADFAIITAPPTVALANGAPDPRLENAAARIGFTIALSAATNEDVLLTYSTVDGAAVAGSDFVGIVDGQVTIAAGSTSATVWISLLNDDVAEAPESFTLRLDSAQLASSGTALAITTTAATGNIADDDGLPSVLAVHDMAAIGSTDPSGLAYVPATQTLFLSDAEVNEDPFLRPDNLFGLRTDGALVESFRLGDFTDEPTGLAFDPVNGHLFISDDDEHKVFWVDPADPTVMLGEFATGPLGGDDPEDLAFNPADGHLFILNGGFGFGRNIVETDRLGTQVFSTVALPEEISDPEALAYDAHRDVFYVGGSFSANIWVVDRSGSVLDVIDIFEEFRNPIGDKRVHVNDLELAPSSDPYDDPGKLSLFVADFGWSHVDDGRLLEIDLGDPFWA